MAIVLTLGKTTQFVIPDPPTGVELEQLTDSPPHICGEDLGFPQVGGVIIAPKARFRRVPKIRYTWI